MSQLDGSRGNWVGRVDSILGAQVNYQFNELFEAVSQAAVRYRDDGTYRPEVGWAFLKYNVTPGLSLRAGRVGVEIYMLADSRQIGYSYLPVRPPIEYFGSLPIYHMDGLDAVLTIPRGPGVVKLKAFYGQAVAKYVVDGVMNWDISGSRVFGGYVDYFQSGWQWRLSYAQLRFNSEAPIGNLLSGLRSTGFRSALAAADAISMENRDGHYYSLGVVYDRGPVLAQLMLSYMPIDGHLLEDSTAFYGLMGRRYGAFMPYAGFSSTKSGAKNLSTGLPDSDPLFFGINSAVAGLRARAHVNQQTWFAGVRWDVMPHVALKVQLDMVRGRSDSVMLVQRADDSWDGRTNVLSVVLDFAF